MKKPLSDDAKYLFRLLEQFWGAGLTIREMVEVFDYTLEEVDTLIRELKQYRLVKDFTLYGTTEKGYRAELGWTGGS